MIFTQKKEYIHANTCSAHIHVHVHVPCVFPCVKCLTLVNPSWTGHLSMVDHFIDSLLPSLLELAKYLYIAFKLLPVVEQEYCGYWLKATALSTPSLKYSTHDNKPHKHATSINIWWCSHSIKWNNYDIDGFVAPCRACQIQMVILESFITDPLKSLYYIIANHWNVSAVKCHHERIIMSDQNWFLHICGITWR